MTWTMPTALTYAILRPLVALVLQGSKRVIIWRQTFDFSARDLDLSLLEGLVMEMGCAPYGMGTPVQVDHTESEILEAALRLLCLPDHPDALAVLQAQPARELHYWRLSCRHGGAILALGVADSNAQRIRRAVSVMRPSTRGRCVWSSSPRLPG